MIEVNTKEVILYLRKFEELPRRIQRKAFMKASGEIGKEFRRLHREATSTWERPIVPRVMVRFWGGNMSVTATVDDKIWSLINFGARRHPITPSSASHLVFPWGGKGSYVAKSKVRTLQAQSGSGRNTGPIQYRMFVDHPGFKGRKLHEEIAKKILPYARKKLAEEVAKEVARRV